MMSELAHDFLLTGGELGDILPGFVAGRLFLPEVTELTE
jgi:hypothetical protein